MREDPKHRRANAADLIAQLRRLLELEIRCSALLGLAVLEEIFDRETNIFCDLAKQNRRDVSSLMKRHGRTTPSAIAKLFMRPTLPDLDEAELEQNGDNFGWLENWEGSHELGNCNVVNPDKL